MYRELLILHIIFWNGNNLHLKIWSLRFGVPYVVFFTIYKICKYLLFNADLNIATLSIRYYGAQYLKENGIILYQTYCKKNFEHSYNRRDPQKPTCLWFSAIVMWPWNMNPSIRLSARFILFYGPENFCSFIETKLLHFFTIDFIRKKGNNRFWNRYLYYIFLVIRKYFILIH